jgi:uncharacterized membrane protein YjgN (DUF898 family)
VERGVGSSDHVHKNGHRGVRFFFWLAPFGANTSSVDQKGLSAKNSQIILVILVMLILSVILSTITTPLVLSILACFFRS